MAATRGGVVLAAVGLLLAAVAMAPPAAGLSPDFYAKSCPQLDGIVRDAVKVALRGDGRIAAGLLRIFFHDCFAQGCDASIFLEPERVAPPNLSLQQPALNLIEDIRGAAHKACGGEPKVSCADIIALATCEAVNQTGGPKIRMPVGRTDSLRSATPDEVRFLPDPSQVDLKALREKFRQRNLPDAEDLVALSGGHTVGQARCGFARDNFQGQCQNGKFDLDGTPLVFDNRYFKDLSGRKGVLPTDHALIGDSSTSRFVAAFAKNKSAFFEQFAKSMIRMGSFVVPGAPGETRRFNCNRINKQAIVLDTAADDEGFAASA